MAAGFRRLLVRDGASGATRTLFTAPANGKGAGDTIFGAADDETLRGDPNSNAAAVEGNDEIHGGQAKTS